MEKKKDIVDLLKKRENLIKKHDELNSLSELNDTQVCILEEVIREIRIVEEQIKKY